LYGDLGGTGLDWRDTDWILERFDP
jgi:hypothetical protein